MKKYRIVLSREDKKDVLNVEGCFGIEKYSRYEISVLMDGFSLDVFGNELIMPVMNGGTLMICGEIEGIKKVKSL